VVKHVREWFSLAGWSVAAMRFIANGFVTLLHEVGTGRLLLLEESSKTSTYTLQLSAHARD